MTVSLFLKTLISRLNYVPTYTPSDETSDPTQAGVPQQERSRLKARRVERVQRLLRGALLRAIAHETPPNPGAPAPAALLMKDLYLSESYADVAKKDAIDDLCEQFWAAQQVVRWLCMPFLQYTDLGADPALTRPSIADLVRHLDGDNAPPPPVPPGAPPAPPTSIFGVRNLTYRQFAFLSTVSPAPPAPQEDLKAKYFRTRNFAFDKGFFNKDNVVANYYKNLVKDIQSVLGAEGSAAISALSDKGILGGGNGYRCHYNPTTQQKSCIPGAATDYCANGGQTCTG